MMPEAQIGALWPAFHAFAWFPLPDGRRLASVLLDRETMDFAHLLRQEVLIDGALYRCTGVERFVHSPPWLRGEQIGLAVVPLHV
jgi:hypothetical protein